MAKKQLKKLNQPKKYLQGGSNMGSLSMMRQNPYYLGQVNQDAAEEDFATTQEQLMQTKENAVQAKKDAEAQKKAEMDQSIRSGAGKLIEAGAADKKAGNLGKLFTKTPTPIGNPNPFAFLQAPAQSIGTGTAIEGVGVLAPEYMPAAQAGLGTAADAGVGVLAPEFIVPAAENTTNIASTAGQTTAGLSNLATAGIGVAANVGGRIIKNRTNDDDAYTFTDKERKGNVGGSALSSAGTGFGIGATVGSIVPGVGNVVGGLIGAGIGAGVGAIKARKENKAAKEEADRLQRDLAAQRGAFQSAFVNSRLTGADTGFGLNSSTNMNNQFTNSYQVARLGGTTGIQEDRRTKKVPGGKIVPIEGTDAVEFIGKSHEKGGVTIDKNTEVEGGETMDQVAMSNNNKQDYIFSKYLKLGGKSFAQRHKEILKGTGSQADIQQLAAMQEKVAGRDSKQVAQYGGVHKYIDGGAKPCPECPPGTICDIATGACVPDEDNGPSNPYDWNATGMEGFKAGQNAKAPAAPAKQEPEKPAGKQISQADYDFYIREKNARLADEQNKIAAQNGTSNAPADATATVNPGVQPPANTQPVATTTNPPANTTATTKEKGWGAAGAPSPQIDQDQDPTVDPTGTATYNPAPGVAPQAGATVTTTNPPAAANTGTSTDPTVTYVNSNDPNAPAPAPQTPEEIEAARLAGLPRMFMGASRKVDEATGNVTIDKGKPLMGVGAMAGSRLGTATGSQEDLDKVTNSAYDQAWSNKADNLYTNQVDASGGGLSFSNYVTDRDKIAGSNWGKKYGYTVGMSEAEAKAAHGKFEEDVHSLFKNNPDEMMGYFQYIIDGGDPNTQEDAKNKKPGTYLGKDAEQIRANLKNKGFIGADGKVIPGKEKAMQTYLEEQATDNFVGPIHNALGSYTAERGSSKIKLEEKKKKDEEITLEIPKKREPCPPGTYLSSDGSCQPVPPYKEGNKINGSLMAGLGQLVPVGAALLNPYKIAPGISGAPSIKGPLMPRMNLNQERASAIQQNVAFKNAVLGQNAGPGALAAMQSANTKTNQQMLQIGKQEQDQNKQLAAQEGSLAMDASKFNAEADQKRQMFNTEFNQKERQYRREDILGALDAGASRIAGIVKDERSYKANERLARALDETHSYDRFSIYEQLTKQAKQKNSPYNGVSDAELRRMAAGISEQIYGEMGVVAEAPAATTTTTQNARTGGVRQYVSRLGELKGVRATKAKL